MLDMDDEIFIDIEINTNTHKEFDEEVEAVDLFTHAISAIIAENKCKGK